MPLLITGLPVFCRWRGRPPFGEPELAELVELADRLVVDSREWDDPAADYPRLAELFDDVAVSDIAWRRTLPWRVELARDWPEIGELRRAHGREARRADAHLLAGWLRSRLEPRRGLTVEPAEDVESVAVDGRELRRSRRRSRWARASCSRASWRRSAATGSTRRRCARLEPSSRARRRRSVGSAAASRNGRSAEAHSSP